MTGARAARFVSFVKIAARPFKRCYIDALGQQSYWLGRSRQCSYDRTGEAAAPHRNFRGTADRQLYRFLAIAVLLDVKDIPQVGPLQWGRIKRSSGTGVLMPDTMLFAWMGDDVEAILLVLAVMIAFVAIVVVLDQKQRGL